MNQSQQQQRHCPFDYIDSSLAWFPVSPQLVVVIRCLVALIAFVRLLRVKVKVQEERCRPHFSLNIMVAGS